MSLSNENIKQKLIEKFSDQLTNWQEPYGMLTFTAAKDLNIKVMQTTGLGNTWWPRMMQACFIWPIWAALK